ncbi:MAG TPA: hypothetical protein VFS21_14575 [Roseiflexaceae bacterium]|nr:hypothetical protein [Roseiflexaceae bacterium]
MPIKQQTQRANRRSTASKEAVHSAPQSNIGPDYSAKTAIKQAGRLSSLLHQQDMLLLQRTIGNQATSRLLQTYGLPTVQRTQIFSTIGKPIPGTENEDISTFKEYFHLFGSYENASYILGEIQKLTKQSLFDQEVAKICQNRIQELLEKHTYLSQKYTVKTINQSQEQMSSSNSSKEKEETINTSSEHNEFSQITMVELLIKAFEESGIPKKYIKDMKLFNLLFDIGLQELKEMEIFYKALKLPEYYKNSLEYTSCHNTAVKLFSRMGESSDKKIEYTGLDKQTSAEKKDSFWLNQVSSALKDAISNDIQRGERSIYEVHCGGHGFAILVRNGTTEILQSFANAVALVERMVRGPLIVGDGKIQNIILKLASSEQQDRDEAANIIADCDAEMFGLSPYPSFQYRWRRQKLLSDTELAQNFKKELKEAFQNVRKILF